MPAPKISRVQQLADLLEDPQTISEFMKLMIGTLAYGDPVQAKLLLEQCLNEELFPVLSELGFISMEEIQRIIYENDLSMVKTCGRLIKQRNQLAGLRLAAYRRILNRLQQVSHDRKQAMLEKVFKGDFETAIDWFVEQCHPDLFGLLMAASQDPLLDESDRLSAEKQAGSMLSKVVYPWEFFRFKTDPDDPIQVEEDLMSYLNKRFGAGTYESLMGHLTEGVVMPLDELPVPDEILVEQAAALEHSPPEE